MSIITKKVILKWNPATKNYYEQKGYLFTKYNDEFQIDISDISPSSTYKINASCDRCGKEMTIPYNYYTRSIKYYNDNVVYCRSCASLNKADKNRQKIAEQSFLIFKSFCDNYGYIPISTASDYYNAKSKMKYICPTHGEKSITIDSIKRGSKCKQCSMFEDGRRKALNAHEVENIVSQKNGDILINPQEYINHSTKNLRIICGSCGKQFITSLSSIENGGGRCLDCKAKTNAAQLRRSKETIIEIANNVDVQILNPQDYIDGSTYNMVAICPKCNKQFITSIDRLINYKPLCQKCRNTISIGQIKLEEIFKRHNIRYIRGKTFQGCIYKRKLIFDFYLPDYNLCVEFDGQQHFQPVFGEESYEAGKIRDEIKNNYCLKNNIGLLRIPYYEGNKMEEIVLNRINSIK